MAGDGILEAVKCWAANGSYFARMAIDDKPAAAPTDAGSVSERVSNVIGDVLEGRTNAAQNRALGTAVERAGRVTPTQDKAVGKAIGG